MRGVWAWYRRQGKRTQWIIGGVVAFLVMGLLGGLLGGEAEEAEQVSAPTRTPEPAAATNPPATTAAPAATSTAPAFASGGLGLPRATWEQQHGRPGRDAAGFILYENEAYAVQFFDGHIHHVERTWGDRNAVSLDDARAASKALLPADAQFTRTYLSRERTVDLYHSATFANQPGGAPWTGGEPGDFIVLYRQNPAGRVTSIVVAAGNNP